MIKVCSAAKSLLAAVLSCQSNPSTVGSQHLHVLSHTPAFFTRAGWMVHFCNNLHLDACHKLCFQDSWTDSPIHHHHTHFCIKSSLVHKTCSQQYLLCVGLTVLVCTACRSLFVCGPFLLKQFLSPRFLLIIDIVLV